MCSFLLFSAASCDALYNIAQVDFNFCSLFYIISFRRKSFIQTPQSQLMKNSCKFKYATWRFHSAVSSSRFHSFILSHARSSPHIFPRPCYLLCINATTRPSHSTTQRSKKKEAQKSCRWVIVMVTYTRYTQKYKKRPFNTVNVRQCSMICKKYRDCFFSSFFFYFTFCLGPFLLPVIDGISKLRALAKKHRKNSGLCFVFDLYYVLMIQ